MRFYHAVQSALHRYWRICCQSLFYSNHSCDYRMAENFSKGRNTRMARAYGKGNGFAAQAAGSRLYLIVSMIVSDYEQVRISADLRRRIHLRHKENAHFQASAAEFIPVDCSCRRLAEQPAA
jgi:hypothetical protein